MKEDRAFLAGMWQKAGQMADLERETAAALRRSRRMVRQWIMMILTYTALLFLTGFAAFYGTRDTVYFVMGIAMVLGIAADQLVNSSTVRLLEED